MTSAPQTSITAPGPARPGGTVVVTGAPPPGAVQGAPPPGVPSTLGKPTSGRRALARSLLHGTPGR